MGFLSLLVTSSMPVLEVLIVTAVGSILALGRVGLLTPEARKYMNNIVFYVFFPNLVANNLASTITASNLVKLWFMPVNVFLTFVIGSLLGWLLIKILKAPRHLKGLIIGCCSAGNLGNIVMIVIPALCEETGSPFGDSSTCKTYGLAYASLSMAIGAIFIWGYCYNLVRILSADGAEEDELNGYEPFMDSPEDEPKLLPRRSSVGLTSAEDFPMIAGLFEDHGARSSPRIEEFIETEKAPFCTRLKRILKGISSNINLKKMLTPSTIAVIIGFFIGLIVPLRHAFIGDEAPLRAIEYSASLLSNAAIPTTTLIMGGNLLKGIQSSGVPIKIVLGVIVVRYIVLPLCGIGVLKAAVYFGFVSDDALYQFVLLLQFAVPPAMSISTIIQLFGVGEGECAVVFLWTYAVASVALTLWCTFFMFFVSS